MYAIHTLKLGELMIPQGGALLRDPIYAWLITDGRRHILVDSGMPDAADVKRRLKVDGKGGGHLALRTSLAEVGVTPESISTIILTHLHFDHAWNLDLFPNACVIAQRDELFHAIDPAATQRIFYFKETLIGLLQRKRPSRFRIVDGDVDLTEGVRLLKVPGHTPGMQAVVVTTSKGEAALVSDLGDHYRCWHPADRRATASPMKYLDGAFLPGPIRSESEAVYIASMTKVRAAADIVVPAHDFRIPTHMPSEWFDIPASTDGDLAHAVDAAE